MESVDDILRLVAHRGDSQYGGEAVTQQQHALQAAVQAEAEEAGSALITAALLHDLGHLLHDLPADSPDSGVDDRHERSAASYLKPLFPAEVTEPVRLHVEAKRYLCAIDPKYRATLSQPSMVSLELQGGAMGSEEVRAFASSPHCAGAVRLRRWDDKAKVADCITPSLQHFRQYVLRAALSQ